MFSEQMAQALISLIVKTVTQKMYTHFDMKNITL